MCEDGGVGGGVSSGSVSTRETVEVVKDSGVV